MTPTYGSMQGKTCLITGATRGLGQSTALGLARLGATVIIIGRNQTRIENTLALLRAETGNHQVEGIRADLSSQNEIRRVADILLARGNGIDVLVNNVGATRMRYQSSPDGIELTWALNYLGHFLLSNLLLDTLHEAAAKHGEARIIEIASSMYRFANPRLHRMEKQQGYNGVLAYAKSKRAMILFTKEMARRLQGTGVTINAVSPGFVRTGIASGNGVMAKLAMKVIELFSLSPDEGAQPIIHLAASPDVYGISGRYYYQFKCQHDQQTLGHDDDADNLWRVSQAATGDPQSSVLPDASVGKT